MAVVVFERDCAGRERRIHTCSPDGNREALRAKDSHLDLKYHFSCHSVALLWIFLTSGISATWMQGIVNSTYKA